MSQKLAETERLEAELAQLKNKKQKFNQKIAKQRVKLESGKEEIRKLDAKVAELQVKC